MSIDSPVVGDTQITKASALGVRHVAGSPYYPFLDSLEGWTGAAASRTQLNNSARADFYVPLHVVGVTVGLYDGFAADYTRLTHALYLNNGAMRVMESGVLVGGAYTYVSADKLTIKVNAGVVTYLKNDSVFYTSLVAPTGTARNLSVFLYAAGDALWNLAISPLVAPTAAGTASFNFAPLFVGGGGGSFAALQFAPLTFVGGRSTAPTFNQAQLELALLDVVGSMYGSESSVGNFNFAPLFATGSDYANTANGAFNFAPLYVVGQSGINVVVILDMGTIAASDAYTTDQALVALFMAAGLLSGSPTAYIALPASISAFGLLTGTFAMDPKLLGVLQGALSLAGTVGGSLGLISTILSAALASGSFTAAQVMQAFFSARALLGGVDKGNFNTTDLPTRTWVTNIGESLLPQGGTATNYATSRYEGFDFNSFALVDGRYYGARSDGIYLLEGDDDVGERILASIDYGNVRVAGGALARVANAYIGTTSTGRLFMRVTANDKAYVYESRNARDRMSTQRVDFGKGFRDSYFNFEIYNGDGEDFDISSVEFVPLKATRRI